MPGTGRAVPEATTEAVASGVCARIRRAQAFFFGRDGRFARWAVGWEPMRELPCSIAGNAYLAVYFLLVVPSEHRILVCSVRGTAVGEPRG